MGDDLRSSNATGTLRWQIPRSSLGKKTFLGSAKLEVKFKNSIPPVSQVALKKKKEVKRRQHARDAKSKVGPTSGDETLSTVNTRQQDKLHTYS